MQFTLIAVQNNGQQIVLGQDIQEHRVMNMVLNAVGSSNSGQVRKECQYRSFFALGTTENTTQVWRMNASGEVMARQVGIV